MHRSTATLEPLDPRILLAATPFPLLTLLGYDRRGASYDYTSKYSVRGTNIEPIDGRADVSVDVRSKLKSLRGQPCVMVDTTTPAGAVTTAFYTTKKGTFCPYVFVDTPIGDVTVNLTDPFVAPKSVALGQTIKDSSPVTGSIVGDSDYFDFIANFSGKADVTTRLIDRQTVTVPAGTFADAIHGSLTFTFTATFKARISGVRFNVSARVDVPTEFWAVEGQGIVLSSASVAASAKLSGGPAGNGTYSVTAATTNKLTSSSLPSAVRRAIAITPFSDSLLKSDDALLEA